ncbi:DUF6531 domain-containing protein [Rothia aeria]|uniref:DUF6531 domain-containing protein n=1 Tax=Rothia aeria TaxID=172042 RepID=UPI0024470111|nr:DUF6531 domain-containing protein [Rothia aeria]
MSDLAHGKVSGIPEHLIKYYNVIKGMSPRVEQDYNAMKSSYETFKSSTDWGKLDATDLIAAVYVWSQDNLVEAFRAGKIGEELWKAGSQGELSKTNPNLSDPRVLHSVESSVFVNDKDLKKLPTKHMLPYVPSAGVLGAYPSSGFRNDPVNIATGNFIEYELDLAFDNTAATALSLERMYNSFTVAHPKILPSGIFGPGWCSTLDTRLNFTSESAQWYTKDGRILHFSRSGDGYDRTPQEPWWLTKVLPNDELYEWITQMRLQAVEQVHDCKAELAQNTYEETGFSQVREELASTPHYWIIEDNKHARHVYNSAGAWVGTADGHLSDAMVPVYATAIIEPEGGSQRVITDLVHPVAHRAIHLDYELDSAGGLRPTQAYAYNTAGESAGAPQAAVGYRYAPEGENAAGHLCAVEKMNGTRTYTHTPEHLIHEVTDVNGHVEVANTYDGNGRVIRQHTEYDDDISYNYTSEGVTTVAQAETGLKVNIFYSDPKGRLIGVMDGNGKRYSIRYGTGDNRISITDRDGSITNRSFDRCDRLVRERTPEGTDYTYSWDEYNRITGVSVCDARDTLNLGTPINTLYEYADSVNPNPSAVIAGNGAKTQLIWDEHGRLMETIDPTGVRTVMTYDIHGDLKTMTDGVGNTTTLVRDGAGRVTQVIDPLGRSLRIQYNAAGMISSFEEATGARWSFAYQEAPKTSQVPALLRAAQRFAALENTDITGDQERGNLPHTVTDPHGNVTTLTYNRAREITSVTDPLGRTTQNIYNQSGNLAQVIEASGATWTYEYDGIRQLIAAIDPLGGVTRYTYNPVGNRTSETDPTGVKIKQDIDRKHGLERTTSAYGTSFKQVDVFGRVVAQKTGVTVGSSEKPDAEEFITYDHAGNPVEIVDARGGLTRIIRDLAGRPVRVVSPAGRVQTYEYDAAGRLVQYAMGLDEPTASSAELQQEFEPTQWAVTRLVYDAASQVVTRILPDGSTEHIDYDAAGRVIKVAKGARSARYEYDLGGRLVGLRDNTYGYRRFTYDAAGQLIQTVDGLGNRTHMKYDAAGNISQVMDSTGQVTRYEYDALNRLTRTINAAGTAYEYGYDAAGRLIRAFDGVHERTYEYDYKRGGELRYAFCDGVRIAQYGSENRGRIVWVRDYATAQALDTSAPAEAYVEHRYEYDSAGQLIKRSRSAVIDPQVPNEEPKISELTDVESQVQALNAFVSTGAYTLTYAYDADGNRTSTVTPYGTSQVVYDGAGHVVSRETRSVGESEPIVSTYSYDVMGQLVRAQVGDIVSTWQFDASGRVAEYGKSLVAENGSNAVSSTKNQGLTVSTERTQITRDAEGRVVGVQTDESLVMYSYDAAGQLVGAREGNHEYEWAFDNGLMMTEKLYRMDDLEDTEPQERTLLSERSFEYNVLNQLVQTETLEYAAAIAPEFVGLHREVINRLTTTYEYDAAGYRVREHTASNQGIRTSREYEWGVWGGLSSVTTTSNSDAFHTEVLGVRGVASRVRLVTDAAGELAQITGADRASVPVLWDSLSDTPQVLGVGAVPAPENDGGFSQVGVPQGFNPWGVPDLSGMAHMPGFGSSDPLNQVLPAGVSFTGAGSVRVAGLDVMGARTFDGASKRFLSTDPLAPVTGSPWFADAYSFVGSNPMNMVDPWGTTEVSVELAKDTSFNGWLSRNRQEVSHVLIAVGVVAAVISIPIPGLSAAIVAGVVSGGTISAGITLNSDASLKSDGYVDTGDVALSAVVGGVSGGFTAAASYGVAYGVETWVVPKVVQGASKVRGTFAPSTASVVQPSERIVAAETKFIPQGSKLINSSNTATRAATVESKLTSASPTAVAWENVPVVAAGSKGVTTSVSSGIPTRTVTVSANQGKAVPLVATGPKGASSLRPVGPAQVGKVPPASTVSASSRGTQTAGAKGTSDAAKVDKSMSVAKDPSKLDRLKAVGTNAAVNGATGAAVNGVSYTGQSLMGLTPEPFNTGELFNQMATGATGNILGGSVKPVAGSIGNYLGFRPGGFRQNSLEAGLAGGMSVANGELWAGLSGNPTSGGDKVYNFLSGGTLSQVGNFGPKNHKLEDVKVGSLGQPLKAPGYLGSYRQMGLGHPGVAHPSPSWKPLALNSTTNAGLVAVSDGAKKYVVDRLLNFEGAPAHPVPSPDSAGETAGFGTSDSGAQVREPGGVQVPEYIQELEDIQVPEDSYGSENVQEPEYVYPVEGVYIPADAQPEEGLTQGQNFDEVDEGVVEGLSQDDLNTEFVGGE